MAIGAQQRLALDAVDDEDLRLAAELPIRRESGAACAHDTGVADLIDQSHRRQIMRKPSSSTQRRARVKLRAEVSPSPVGVAMVRVA